MFEMLVEDAFSLSGVGTVFVGMVRSGPVSIGDRVVCKTSSAQMSTHVIGLQEVETKRSLPSAQAGSRVNVICKNINLKSLSDAIEQKEVNLVSAVKKHWWQF
jgi:selenocysteine-specific translation elongation factor